ncbi:hypothetical protein phiAS5_ORF0211 [Aeromonas phage phiAS5]|uniref:Uncharacterized protein n=1 Tax=Aeromonas phage phiAS5 TaxID=879630 RepID=E1A2V8_9CAUD|nr:hypothetical protein phiAS5_ORF0211 [Aeromonas phage phiAS5]ADM80054.1 hypothetical protein phiAS5_ORF0211 [Aeromonas phage phiAS5]
MVTMKREQVYPVHVDISERESKVFAYVTIPSVGTEISKGKGWWGGNGHVNSQPVDVLTFDVDGEKISFLLKDRINVITSKDQFQSIEQEKLKKQALAKLSTAERKALGLA